MRAILPWLLSVVLLVISSSFSTASAQSAPMIEQLHIALWPEFDRSSVLVIYRVSLKEDTPLPAWVSLPIPTSAGEPHAAAWRSSDGQLLVADYERKVEGEWATIKLVAMSSTIQMEYYQELDIAGSNRNFRFNWPGGYQVDALSYEVQQPVGVSDVKVDPAPTDRAQGSYGLTYLSAQLGQLTKKDTFTIDLNYVKTSNELSAEAIAIPQQFPSSPSAKPEGRAQHSSRVLTLVIGILIVVLLLLGGRFYTQYRRQKNAPTSRRDSVKRGKRQPKGKKEKVVENSGFCHDCGKRTSPSDRYCRHCGTELH
ncbi:MAG: hypothetical protein GTN74_12770 [Proteobacteria bacterium]|nr:hypothetical protein [Pseudomonadota bacterium]